MTEFRTKPASNKPNNQDAFIWSLHLLGGSDRQIDVEDLFLKCFEIAPARLGWRTRPELPDYKKISKALQSVEAKTHCGLVQKIDQYHRRLTIAGVNWVLGNEVILKKVYGGEKAVTASNNSTFERKRTRLRKHSAWSTDEPDLTSLADALECTPLSGLSVWRTRLTELERTAQVLKDDDLTAKVAVFKEVLRKNGIAI
jgi:hypothetical protein